LGHVVILFTAFLVLAAAPLSAAGHAPRSASANSSARIAFEMVYPDRTHQSQIGTVRADRRGGVRQLVPGMHNQDFCQSANGRKIAYYSDDQAPRESSLYVANADGTDAQKITGKQVGFLCPFSERWLLLIDSPPPGGCGGGMAIVRHDLQTGAEETVVTNVDDRLSLSPDGNKLLFVGGLDYTHVTGHVCPTGKETLELLDLTTLEQQRLGGPLARAKSYGIASCSAQDLLVDARHCLGEWSPDSRRIAFTIGPSVFLGPPDHGQPSSPLRAHRFAIYVQPVVRGAARLKLRSSGGPPLISWSPDGSRLLVCARNRGLSKWPADTACSGAGRPSSAGKLLLVDLARRSVRRVVSGTKLLFAQWAPSGTTYAYATPTAAYVVRRNGARRLLASAPKPRWSGGRWMGWSPDGRYIGLGSSRNQLAVLNAATGQIHVLIRDRKAEFRIFAARWWR
jgi:WD40 repeat protein